MNPIKNLRHQASDFLISASKLSYLSKFNDKQQYFTLICRELNHVEINGPQSLIKH